MITGPTGSRQKTSSKATRQAGSRCGHSRARRCSGRSFVKPLKAIQASGAISVASTDWTGIMALTS